MAAIRHTIQKEVFSPLEERLVGIVNVTKPGRKKKASFLCISVNLQEKPPQVFISRVKSAERKASDKVEREGYRRVKTWRLAELRLVDGKSEDAEVPDFDLHFDKTTFKWIASSVSEKKAFITCLYKLVHKYADRKKPVFAHIDEERLQELLHSVDIKTGVGGSEDVEEVVQQEEYQELTAQEEADLENLLSRDNAIQDAGTFTENLSEELAQLDDANIHTMIGAETQIHELMQQLDKALVEIGQMETKLSVYDELLGSVRSTMQRLGKQYSQILVENKNYRALYEEVDDLVTKLDVDPRVERVLMHAPLTGPSHIRDCSSAALSLQEALSQELSQGVAILQAVSEQQQFFSNLSANFGRRLHEHLSALFVQYSSQIQEAAQVRHPGVATISSHSAVHSDLLPYSSLMKWMKECEVARFSDVMEAYIRNFRRVYEEEIRGFMTDSKAMLGRVADIRKPGFLSKVGSNADMGLSLRSPGSIIGGSLMILSPSSRAAGGVSASIADFSSAGTFGASDPANRPKFDQVFSMLLEQLQPVCMSEQKFLNSFFHFPKPELVEDAEEEEEPVEGAEVDEPDISFLRRQQTPTVEVGEGAAGLQGVLGQVFFVLLPEIEGFITFGDRLDSYNALYLLVSVSQRLMFAQESGGLSYLDETLKKALIFIRRLFDKFIISRKRAIEDMKMPKGAKCGILPCVHMFSEFAERAESIIMATDRRGELDKAYRDLIEAVFKTIERVAHEHPKTPPDVIKFENYHKMVDTLSRFKISCLETSRDEAKRKFRAHRHEYVVNCLGRPLEKLSLFFEGVEGLIASGTKAEEVGYRLDYSRSELKKCIKEYPGKEVKKGLEKLYRRVERDVAEEVLRVVWGAMQEAFMGQFHHFHSLMDRCYPGSNLTLEFNISDLNDYFSSISQQ